MNAAVFAEHSPHFSLSQFQRMRAEDVAEVLSIENRVYPFPWTLGNFMDSLYSRYENWILRSQDNQLQAYFLMMCAVDEAHLLNITVHPELHGLGLGRRLLDQACAVARTHQMHAMILEVRPSNVTALRMYAKYGFTQIGRRTGYYPAAGQIREDALVMRKPL